MEKFLENLYCLLNEKGITKNKFLGELNLGKKSFINWESRDTLPNGNTLVAIADYFDVSLDYLIGRKEKHKESDSHL